MPTYIGYSTQDVGQVRNEQRPGNAGGIGNLVESPYLGKKYRLTDVQLVLRDFLNAFNIKPGDKVGNPGYGTTLWEFVFEPNIDSVRTQIEDEVRRVASSDPRMTIGSIDVFAQENGILIELEIAITPFSDTVQVGFFLNRFDGSIQQLSQ